jgi:nicotinate phosphoribosyltransferase
MNLALLTDLYQLTMMGGYQANHKMQQRAVFDLFFRKVPDGGGYCVAAGLGPALDYLRSLRFDPEAIAYLRELGLFDDAFLAWLADFCFTGDVMAVPEGTLVFPGEPLLRVSGTLPEVQLVETTLLNIINFQTLVATKAARICQAAEGASVLEFGLRRAQGPDGALSASRAAYVGGVHATSNVEAGRQFAIPVKGTHAHSWVMSFDSELEAFRAYARAYPDHCTFLVDTFDTLQSGLPNAITVAHEMEASGHRLEAIRLDSGDLAYLSKESRRMLDEAGLGYVKIVASSDLDEWLIHDLKNQGARIDVWGVGTKLVTAYSTPALGGVYKLASASDASGAMVARIKLSSNPEKTTSPGVKQVWRFYDAEGRMLGDVIALEEESFAAGRKVVSRHPMHFFEKRTLAAARVEPLLQPAMRQGACVAELPPLSESRARTAAALASLRAEHKRFYNADLYWVGLSQSLFGLRARLIEQVQGTAGSVVG